MFRVDPASRTAFLASSLKEGQNSLKRALEAQQNTCVACTDCCMYLGLGRWSQTWLGKLRQESLQHAM